MPAHWHGLICSQPVSRTLCCPARPCCGAWAVSAWRLFLPLSARQTQLSNELCPVRLHKNSVNAFSVSGAELGAGGKMKPLRSPSSIRTDLYRDPSNVIQKGTHY